MKKFLRTSVLILIIVCCSLSFSVLAAETPDDGRLYFPSDAEIDILAKTIYGEAGCVKSKMEQAAVVWCILNRIDAGYGETVTAVATAKGQFHGYKKSHPIKQVFWDLAYDVVCRWIDEHQGYHDVGRVLPKEYLWFSGNKAGTHNIFRDAYCSAKAHKWNWSLLNPYLS